MNNSFSFLNLPFAQIAGSTLGHSLSSSLIEWFDITLQDFSRLWQLILFCSLVRLVTLPFIPMLPTKLPSRDASTSAGNRCADSSGAAVLDLECDEEPPSPPSADSDNELLQSESEDVEPSDWRGAAALLVLLVLGIAWSLGMSIYQLIRAG